MRRHGPHLASCPRLTAGGFFVEKRQMKKNTPRVPTSERVVCSVDEARQILPVGKTRLYELINDGQIESVMLGKRRPIKIASLHALVERLSK
jgi:excisionase family DNA binding protein